MALDTLDLPEAFQPVHVTGETALGLIPYDLLGGFVIKESAALQADFCLPFDERINTPGQIARVAYPIEGGQRVVAKESIQGSVLKMTRTEYDHGEVVRSIISTHRSIDVNHPSWVVTDVIDDGDGNLYGEWHTFFRVGEHMKETEPAPLSSKVIRNLARVGKLISRQQVERS